MPDNDEQRALVMAEEYSFTLAVEADAEDAEVLALVEQVWDELRCWATDCARRQSAAGARLRLDVS